MELKTNCAIHNKFEIEVLDAKTGEIKQKETAYNIVLDSMWTKLCNGTDYFNSIVFGTGEGIPSPERTSLFQYLGVKGAITVETVKEIPTSKWKRKIVLNPEEYIGQKITEFGIGGSSVSSSIVTHAMLKDSEGNPISILKTDTDVITIYATVYVTLSINYANMFFSGLHNNSNNLLNYLVGGSSAPSGSFSLNEIKEPNSKLGTTGTASWVADIPRRQRKTGVMRFGITTGNGFAGFLEFSNLFVMDLAQSSFFSGQPYSEVILGTGDDLKKEWMLPSNNIKKSSIKVYTEGLLHSGIDIDEFYDYPVRMSVSKVGYPGESTAVRISNNKQIMVIGGKSSPFIGTSEWIDGSWVKRADPDVYPKGRVYNLDLSSDGRILAVAHDNAPYISTYDWIGGGWIKRSDPIILPTAYARDLALSSDGNVMAVIYNTDRMLITYDWNGSNWIARSLPPELSNSYRYNVALSGEGNVMAIKESDSPHVITFEWDGEKWIKRTPISNNPGMNTSNIILSKDGSILIYDVYEDPFICIFDWNGEAWIRRDNGVPILTRRIAKLASNSDCTVISVANSDSPYLVSVYDLYDNTWRIRTAANSITNKFPTGIDISEDGVLVTTTHGDSPYLAMYEYIRSTMVRLGNPPKLNQAVTADYVVEGIHKTDQYVVDVSFAIQFGEGV